MVKIDFPWLNPLAQDMFAYSQTLATDFVESGKLVVDDPNHRDAMSTTYQVGALIGMLDSVIARLQSVSPDEYARTVKHYRTMMKKTA